MNLPIPQEDESGEIDIGPMTRVLINTKARQDFHVLDQWLEGLEPNNVPPLVMLCLLRNTYTCRNVLRNWHAAVGLYRKSCTEYHKIPEFTVSHMFRGLNDGFSARYMDPTPR